MRIKIDRFLTSEPFISFLYRFVQFYSWTFRLKVENEKEWMEYVKNGDAVLICCWHQQIFTGICYSPTFKIFKPCIMISQSKDGEIAAGVAKRAGWNPVRGSSSRGGVGAFKKMLYNFKETKIAAHIVDGPRGPSGKVKDGVIRLAHAANAVIVPGYAFAENGWYFNSWDKFLLPKPFSKVLVRFGKALKFDKMKDKKSLEKQRKQLEEIMLPALKV